MSGIKSHEISDPNFSTEKPEAHDLSEIAYEGGESHQSDRVVIVVSKWNKDITEALYQGAISVLTEVGVRLENILRYDVPGSFELPTAASIALNKHYNLDGVICLGCIIQGETRHFEFIANAVANGIMQISLNHSKPVIFGVLTPDTHEQAKARAGGNLGNKGAEAAVALLEMIDLERG
ncbi:MAG: 6,7-dimethyl-8-ribityllumazine synthase [Bacteroidetes bacterium]|nr:6,7-dimethyl-8-ribityllumazine synthase [Bacteroidota bacterium]